jgi:hypothetical protein
LGPVEGWNLTPEVVLERAPEAEQELSEQEEK